MRLYFNWFFLHTYTYLVEAAMEDFFYFISFKGDGLEVSFVIVVEERQGFSRVCGEGAEFGGEGG